MGNGKNRLVLTLFINVLHGLQIPGYNASDYLVHVHRPNPKHQ